MQSTHAESKIVYGVSMETTSLSLIHKEYNIIFTFSKDLKKYIVNQY